MATIKDVASRAGVSVATVSYILNDTKPVSAATRERVMAAIAELNYVPNKTAKNFKTGQTKVIAFIVPDISNIYFTKIVEAMESRLHESGYSLIVANTKESAELEIQHLRTFTSGFADGIILASTMTSYTEIAPCIPDGYPVILLDRRLRNAPADLINVTDQSAISDAVYSLVEAGCRKIGYIGDIPRLSTSRERLYAFRNTMEDCRLPIEDSMIKEANSLLHDAYDKTHELVEAGCQAIIVSNNVMSVDVCLYLMQHPDTCKDIKVVGYEYSDFPQFNDFMTGHIELNEREMGYSAAEQLLSRLRFPAQPPKEILIRNQYREKRIR